MKKEIQTVNSGQQENDPCPEPGQPDRAYTVAAVLSWLIFLALLSAAAYVRQSIFSGPASEPGIRSAMREALGICALVGFCGMASIVTGNGVISLFLPRTLQHAVPYAALIKWMGSSNEKKILNLIRLHELRVYAARTNSAKEMKNLACRLVPLYMLPIHDSIVRRALSPFQKIYFDLAELEELFDENLDVLRRARPDKLMKEGSLAKETAATLQILLLREENYKGVKGRLHSTYLQNDYCRLHVFTITLLVQKFFEKWPKWKDKSEKIITHDSIEKLTSSILAEHPALEKKLLRLKVKGTPWLPVAMEDFFRHAMPEKMVDWRGGKPTLEDLIEKYLKGGRDKTQDTDSGEDK
jgi:hypothetical protein